MSKRESVPVLDQPVVRPERPLAKSNVLSSGALNQPVEPRHTIVSIPFAQISPEVISAAPIHAYLRSQFDNRYSRQCVVRRLEEMIDMESWHALKGVPQFRQIHHANVVLIEQLLAALDEREVERAA